MPLSSSATPTTTLNSPICSAMYAALRAVESAVSVTHVLRAPFEIGLPLLVLGGRGLVTCALRIAGVC